MKTGHQTDKCLSFIQCDLNPSGKRWFQHIALMPTVTISRQTGCDAMAVAQELAGLLESRDPTGPHHWAIFDKDLVEKVLEDHALPKNIAKFMPERRVSAIQDAIEEILGLHPSSRMLLQQTAETIRRLSVAGHVILIGRAANIITHDMKNVFHVRLIAPEEVRIGWVMTRQRLDFNAAREYLHKGDLARKHYVKDHYHAEIDDGLKYDLVINMARLPNQAVAHLIGDAIIHWSKTQ